MISQVHFVMKAVYVMTVTIVICVLFLFLAEEHGMSVTCNIFDCLCCLIKCMIVYILYIYGGGVLIETSCRSGFPSPNFVAGGY